MNEELLEINNRFKEDIADIERFTNVMLYKFGTKNWYDIENELIHIDDIEQYLNKKNYENSMKLSVEELEEILKIALDNYEKQELLYSELSKIRKPDRNDYKTEEERSIIFILESIYRGKDEIYMLDILDFDNYICFIKDKSSDFLNIITENQEDYCGTSTLNAYYEGLNPTELDHICRQLTDHLRYECSIDLIDTVSSGIEFIQDINDLYNITANESQTNMYKQSFILLMANFDAALFDITRILLFNNFFKYIAYFKQKNNETKIDLGKFESFNDFDEMRENIIEELLTSKYAKTLISIIQSITNNELISDTKAKKIFEIFERRNIHLHNKGIVDKKYVEGRTLCQLRTGDYAVVNEQYFIETKEILNKYIDDFCTWISNT